jgi:hypothetical protein
VAICCSTSLGLALEGELGAILLRAAEDMVTGCDIVVGFVEGKGKVVAQIERRRRYQEWMIISESGWSCAVEIESGTSRAFEVGVLAYFCGAS